jgi:hypothetical protein
MLVLCTEPSSKNRHQIMTSQIVCCPFTVLNERTSARQKPVLTVIAKRHLHQTLSSTRLSVANRPRGKNEPLVDFSLTLIDDDFRSKKCDTSQGKEGPVCGKHLMVKSIGGCLRATWPKQFVANFIAKSKYV